MIRKLFAWATLLSVVCFPWQFTALLAIGVSIFEPFVPVIAGLFIDIFYYTPAAGGFPIFTLAGGLATLAALFVRSQLKTSIIRE